MSLSCRDIQMQGWEDYQGWEFANYDDKATYIGTHVFPDLDSSCVNAARPTFLQSLEGVQKNYEAEWSAAADAWCASPQTEADRFARDTAYQSIQLNYVNALNSVVSQFNSHVGSNCNV